MTLPPPPPPLPAPPHPSPPPFLLLPFHSPLPSPHHVCCTHGEQIFDCLSVPFLLLLLLPVPEADVATGPLLLLPVPEADVATGPLLLLPFREEPDLVGPLSEPACQRASIICVGGQETDQLSDVLLGCGAQSVM